MSYTDAVAAAIHELRTAQDPHARSVHVGLELVLYGWATYTRDQDLAPDWDLLGNAAQSIAAHFHNQPPILITLDECPVGPTEAWAATTRLATAIAEHLDRCAQADTVPSGTRWRWAAAAATLRTVLVLRR